MMTSQQERFAKAVADRYTIEREVGAGGMATVYLAHDLRHRRKVALKVLLPEFAAAIGTERFLREIELTAGLHHPHILSLFDSGEADGDLFYVMPYVEGESLRQRLNREPQLPLADVVRITSEVADALAKAHNAGIVHRDIKPENIMLADGHAIVADFGVAKAANAVTGMRGMTTAGVSLGTPAYMAPEQVAADPLIDHRADLYSLGLVAYEMLAGCTPFTAITPQQQMAAHVSQVPAPIGDRRQDCPAALATLVMQCLEKDPGDRPPDAATIVAGLVANRPSIVIRKPRARRIALMVSAAIVASIAVGALWRGFGRAASRPPRLAVLTFENLGAPDDEYFAEGISDDIRGKLARLGGLEVVAGRSSEAYRGTTKSLAEIGRELRVQFILVGKIRWSKSPGGISRVQISPELIAMATGSTRWQEPFDVSLDEIFKAQDGLAYRVANAVRPALPPCRNCMEAAPPRPPNLAAYDHYLRGNALLRRGQDLSTGWLDAIREFEASVKLDSTFSLGWARLAFARAGAYWYFEARSDADLQLAREAAARSLALRMNQADAYVALGYIEYWCRRDYAAAIVQFQNAIRWAPDEVEAQRGLGLVFRREGKFEESVVAFRRTAELDPQNSANYRDLGSTLILAGRPLEAIPWLERQVALAPSVASHLFHALALLKASKQEDAMIALTAASRAGSASEVAATLVNGAWAWFTPLHDVAAWKMLGDVELTPAISDTADYFVDKAVFIMIAGDSARARVLGDSAAALAATLVQRAPDDARHHLLLATANALAQRKESAIAGGLKALEMMPISRDALDGSTWMVHMAHIYLLVGDRNAAMDQIERQLLTRSYFGARFYRTDLRFAPLRGDSRFERLTR